MTIIVLPTAGVDVVWTGSADLQQFRLPTDDVFVESHVVFFDLKGFVFALWPHDELAKDMGITCDSVPGYRGSGLLTTYEAKQKSIQFLVS